MRTSILFQPNGKTVTIRKGENILQAAMKNRISLQHRCGGKGSCTTCKIRIESPDPLVSSPSPQELRMVDEEKIAQGIRLACQTRVYGPVTVSIPEEAWKTAVRNQMEQQSKKNEGI